MWSHNSTKPSSPTWTTTSRLYSPSSPYPPGTRMLWQVEYETPSATIPSPTWGFETQHYPDFVVASVTVPPKAFSGQSLSVKWQVKNIGKSASSLAREFDRQNEGRKAGRKYLFRDALFFLSFSRSIGCVKSFVRLVLQNGLSGVDHLQSPKAWHPLWY